MAFEVKDIAAGHGGWFKPAENADAVAILIEPHTFTPNVSGQFGPKDQIIGDFTVFADEDALSSGRPSNIMKGARLEVSPGGALTRDLQTILGSATIVKLAKVPSKQPGRQDAWVWRQVSGEVRAAVVAYGEAREAAVQAALADAPDF